MGKDGQRWAKIGKDRERWAKMGKDGPSFWVLSFPIFPHLRSTFTSVVILFFYDNGSESAPKIGKDGKRWDKKDGQIWAKMGEDGQR